MTAHIKTISVSEVPPQWIHDVRAIIVREGRPIRRDSTLPVIEVKSINRDMWMVLMLPSSVTSFASIEDRDTVYHWLTGSAELPPIPPPQTP